MTSVATSVALSEPALLTPVQPKERIQTIDILRGFALFGILWMNVDTLFDQSALGHVINQSGYVLADGKFRSLYSFLFGLGFAVQLLRARDRGAPIVPVYLRRLFVLLLIGLAHFIFIWPGDILRLYAVMGVLLLLLYRCSLRTLLVLAAMSLVFETFSGAAIDRIRSLRRLDPETVRVRALQTAEHPYPSLWTDPIPLEALRTDEIQGSYGNMVADRLAVLRSSYLHRWQYFTGMEFCMFLLGLYAGRRGIFQNTAAHLPFLRKVMWWGLGIGLTLNLADAAGDECSRMFSFHWPQFVQEAIYNIGRPALCLFYASGITLLLQNERWQQRLRPLSWAGRMGLTNYLFQSLAFTSILYVYGFGLLPKSSAVMALVLTVLIYLLQIPLSKWWISRYRFGPAEWVWRSLTYLKMQPMRLRQAP